MTTHVWDLETFFHNNNAVAYCICLKINNNDYVFWYHSEMITHFLEKIIKNMSKAEIHIFSHNINFDGFIIIEMLVKKKIKFDWFIREMNLYWIKIYYMNSVIVLRCSYKIIPISLKDLGEKINIKKKIFPYKFISLGTLNYEGPCPAREFFEKNAFDTNYSYEDYAKEHANFNVKKIAVAYCLNDLYILHHVLLKILILINKYGKNLIKNSFSFSAIAYKIYSKNYDKWKIDKIKNDLFTHNYIKNAYYGGRTEVHANPVDKIIHYFDFSGMYAQCMLQNYPTGAPFFEEKNLSVKKRGFHTIKFKCDSTFPILPYRNQKLFFANGVMVGSYWYEEILYAIKHNACEILEHYSSLLYEDEDVVFKEYIEDFNKIKEMSEFHKIFGKNMINGLYGSFALNDEDYVTILCFNEEEFNYYLTLTDIVRWTRKDHIYILNIVKNLKSKKILDKHNKWDLNFKKRNIAMAAVIASKARIKLAAAVLEVKKSGGEVYYMDTDSIFAGYKTNNLNKKYGEVCWSKIFEDAVFISNKFYFIKGEKMKLKGISDNEYTFEDIKKKFFNDEDILIYDNQLAFNKKNYILHQNYSKKLIKLNSYNKRLFDKNKLNTTPITTN